MKLSKRLSAISEWIEKDDIVADIGCDHAQLCIHLIKTNKCRKVYACDVNEGPLAQAKKNIEYYKMSDCITTCLSDGLAALQDDVNCVVIAGMGFETIQSILNNHLEKLHANRTFIIQANKDVEQLRRWISAHHFQMIKEMVVKEDKHYYQILAFRCCEGDVLSEQEIRFGKKMKKDFTFYSLWKYRLSRYEAILRTLDENNPRYKQVFTEMMYIYQEFGS